MHLPELNKIPTARETLSVFGGYDHRITAAEGAFYDMQNLSSDQYPAMTVRGKRGVHMAFTTNWASGDMVYKNGLWYINGIYLIGPDFSEPIVTSPNSKLVSFGAYLILIKQENDYWVPTYVVNTIDGTWNAVLWPKTTFTSNYLSVYLCNADGEPLYNVQYGTVAPADPTDGILWYDPSAYEASYDKPVVAPGVLKRYWADNNAWFEEETYLCVVFPNVLTRAQPGDIINLELPYVQATKDGQTKETRIVDGDKPFEVLKAGTTSGGYGYVVIKGKLTNDIGYSIDANGTPSVERSVTGWTLSKAGTNYTVQPTPWPRFDYMVEANNRLWCCRYGTNKNNDFVNEIYASKLGSFKAFDSFSGISSDSYIVSCGTDGPFTGAANYNGQPIFFKERFMHRVYSHYPFQVTPYECEGVKAGSDRSLAVVGNVLFYHSRRGISYFDGSLPQDIAEPFGGITYSGGGIATGTRDKYFLAFPNSDLLFVYDIKNGLLHKETGVFRGMASDGVTAYASQRRGGPLTYEYGVVKLNDPTGTDEGNVEWNGTTGLIGLNLPDQKYVSNLLIRAELGAESRFSVSAKYDGGDWEHLYTATGRDIRSVKLPIRPKRCDHMRLKFEGRGPVTVFSVTKTIAQGSDVT